MDSRRQNMAIDVAFRFLKIVVFRQFKVFIDLRCHLEGLSTAAVGPVSLPIKKQCDKLFLMWNCTYVMVVSRNCPVLSIRACHWGNSEMFLEGHILKKQSSIFIKGNIINISIYLLFFYN